MKRIIHCRRHYHHRRFNSNRSNDNDKHVHKAYKSPPVAQLVVCATIPRPSLHISSKTRQSKTPETIYRPPSKCKTSIDMTCNTQHVLRLSLPTFSTERVRI